ncbi:MAG TPA: glycogen/starch synthase [bacterium]
MQRKIKIMYISSVIAPFVKTGRLADVARALPKAIKNMNHDIRLFTPKYTSINERKYTLREVIRLKDIDVTFGNKKMKANVKSAFLPDSKVQVYFIEKDGYFNDVENFSNPLTQRGGTDQAEQVVFFNRSLFEVLKILHWQPDIIHCNDWQTALIPLFLKTIFKDDSFFSKTATLFSIHNWADQGVFEKELLPLIDNSETMFYPDGPIEFQAKINFLKTGIVFSDIINTVSKSYAKEAQRSNELSYGLRAELRKRTNDFHGIVNGIDYTVWNPATDSLIFRQFTSKDLSGKIANKKNLVESQGMKFDENKPVIGTNVRLADQKGVDVVIGALDELMKLDLQYIILGTGDEKYHQIFQAAVKKYPGKLRVILKHDDQLIHQVAAGCDLFLIPSRIEPSGLNQLYSLRYGTIPIVYATGGLSDDVKNYDPFTKRGYGFVFSEYSPEILAATTKRAIELYHDKNTWNKLIERAMKLDFSWDSSAEKYIKLYNTLVT